MSLSAVLMSHVLVKLVYSPTNRHRNEHWEKRRENHSCIKCHMKLEMIVFQNQRMMWGFFPCTGVETLRYSGRKSGDGC